MLFPKSYMNDVELNSCKIVLKDDNENTICSVINMTSMSDENNDLSCSNDAPYNSKLSRNDLKTLYLELSSKINEFKDSVAIKNQSMENYLRKQDYELKKQRIILNLQYQNNPLTISDSYFPTVEQCIGSKDFVLKTKSEIAKLIESETHDTLFNQPLDNCADNPLRKLPPILQSDAIEFDFDEATRFTAEFRKWRLHLGLTQYEVSLSLEKEFQWYTNQSSVCRFENNELTLPNLAAMIPTFRCWLRLALLEGRDRVVRNITLQRDERKKQERRRFTYTPKMRAELEKLFNTVKHTAVTPLVYRKYSQLHGIPEQQIRLWMVTRRRRDRLRSAMT